MKDLPQEMTGAQGDHHAGISLQFDPDLRDAVTAMADCGSAIALCLDATEGDFDACVLGAPVCQTDEPWNEGACCPAACAAQFRAARDSGQAPFDAYVRTYALDGSCFPGVPERLQ
jgi:hypothetical protein